MITGLRLGPYHTWYDWGLYLQSAYISFPIPKTKLLSLPGSDGVQDLTEMLTGNVLYNNRTINVEFDLVDGSYTKLRQLATEIAGCIHGRKLPIVFDDDASFFYEGRGTVEVNKKNEMVSGLMLTIDADPYKYENNLGGDWLWDSFDFEVGVIREYENIKVQGNYSLLVPGLFKPVIPVITVSSSMTVEVSGKTYSLRTGVNKIYSLSLGSGDHVLFFKGTGTVSVEYKGGIL